MNSYGLIVLAVSFTTCASDAEGESHGNQRWPNVVGAGKNLWNATYTDVLKHDLLFKYDKFARPAQHFNTTTVGMNLRINHIEIDESKQIMIVNAWNQLEWIDEKLRWNTSDYGDLKQIQIADHEIWQPDIVLYNSAQASNIDHYGNTHCLVRHDGKVIWVPPAMLPVFCDFDFTYWPYDTQTCELLIGSWTYSGQQINLTLKGQAVEVDPKQTGEWLVVKATKRRVVTYYSCCPEPYLRVDYTVTVRRRSPSNHAILFAPAAMSIVLTLAGFWLTPGASEKFLLSGITAIITSMYLIYFTQRLPAVSTNTPIIVQFYAYNLCLVCLSLAVSVVTYNLSRRARTRAVPWIIMRPLTGRLGSLLALPTTKNSYLAHNFLDKNAEEMQECNLEQEDCTNMLTSTRNDGDWLLLAVALDRILFLIYAVIFLMIILFSVL